MIEARRGAVIRCPVWVWIAQKSFPGSKLITGDANGAYLGRVMTANGNQNGIPYGNMSGVDRSVHIAGPGHVRNAADRSMHTNGYNATANGLVDDDPICDSQATKKQSFLLRNKVYRSLQRLKSG